MQTYDKEKKLKLSRLDLLDDDDDDHGVRASETRVIIDKYSPCTECSCRYINLKMSKIRNTYCSNTVLIIYNIYTLKYTIH